MAAENITATPEATESPRPPFVGILRRGWALVLDCVLLYLICRGLNHAARPILLNLNPWLPWIGCTLTFLYFWLANGPVGKGRTLGKVVMHLATVDQEGRSLDARAALKRTILQQFGLLVFLGLNPAFPQYHALIFPEAWRQYISLGSMLLMPICLSWLTALAVSVGVHPYKRGWHDVWGGSYVSFAPVPESFFAVWSSPVDSITAGRLAKHKLITLGFWILALLALSIFPLRILTSPQLREQGREIRALQQQLPMQPYLLTHTLFPDINRRHAVLDQIAAIREQQKRQIQREQQPSFVGDKKGVLASTETLLAQWDFDGETILAVALRSRGVFYPSDLENKAFRQQIEKLRQALWDKYKVHAAEPGIPKLMAKRFVLLLYEPFQLFFNSYNELRGRVSGPADPREGQIEFSAVLPPRPTGEAPKSGLVVTTGTTKQATFTNHAESQTSSSTNRDSTVNARRR